MNLVVDSGGQVRCLYDEAIDLATLGPCTLNRASQVEPDDDGHWWADLSPAHGPKLAPFYRRSQALDDEAAWLEMHWLLKEEASVARDFDLGKRPKPL